jgi:hypothetical protein
VLRPEHEPPDLRGFLKQTLPDYAVPAVFVFLDALPLTPSGKVNRRALPAPDRERGADAAARTAPRSHLEETLARIWSEVLKIEPIGAGDNFFDLGGHSLLATQVAARVQSALDLDLPVRRLFEAPTIADLALAVVVTRAERIDEDVVEAVLAEVENTPVESTV